MSELNVHQKFQMARIKDQVNALIESLEQNPIEGSNLLSKLYSLSSEFDRTKDIIDGKHNITLPEQLKSKVFDHILEKWVEGRDYKEYHYDNVEDELLEMTDTELVEHFEGCSYEDDELTKQVKEYLANQQLMEIVNE